jgi:hypothetical protein
VAGPHVLGTIHVVEVGTATTLIAMLASCD